MKKFVKNSAIAIKNHVKDHKFEYALSAAFVGITVARKRSLDAFLIEKGIDPDEYYNSEYYAEKQQTS